MCVAHLFAVLEYYVLGSRTRATTLSATHNSKKKILNLGGKALDGLGWLKPYQLQ